MSVNMRSDYDAEFDDDTRRILETSGELHGIVSELQALIERIHEEQGELAPRSPYARPTEPPRERIQHLQVLETVDINEVVEESCNQLDGEITERLFMETFPYSLPIMVDAPLLVLTLAALARRILESDTRAELDIVVSTCATRNAYDGQMDGCVQLISHPLSATTEELTAFSAAFIDALGVTEQPAVTAHGGSFCATSPSVVVESDRDAFRLTIRRPLSAG